MERRARVNGNLLQQYHGKPVCMLGTVLRADGGGTAFKIRSSDGQEINIRLKQPINESLTGLIEVYGTGQGKNSVLTDSFTPFPEEISMKFDMAMYNEVVNLVNTVDDSPWKSKDF